jgi:hypothetical protein
VTGRGLESERNTQ